MCEDCDEEQAIADKLDKQWLICDELAYTFKRFKLLNSCIRHSWASELHVLLSEGPEATARYRKAMEWDMGQSWI